MAQLTLNESTAKSLDIVLDAALKAGGLQTFDAVTTILAWARSAQVETPAVEKAKEV